MSLAVSPPSLDYSRLDHRIAFVSCVTAEFSVPICKEFVERGLIVIACARNTKLLTSIAKAEEDKGSRGKLYVIQCNLSKESEIIAMFEEIKSTFGRIDICVNISDYFPFNSLELCQEDGLKNILEAHAMALFWCTRETVKLMQEKFIENGTIIQVFPSGNVFCRAPDAPRMPTADYYMFMALKYTLLAFTENFRRITKNSNCRIACIYPGEDVIDHVLGRMAPLESYQKFHGTTRFEIDVIVGHVMKILEADNEETAKDIMLLPADFY